jgi:hypothetical protein
MVRPIVKFVDYGNVNPRRRGNIHPSGCNCTFCEIITLKFNRWLLRYMLLAHDCDMPILEGLWFTKLLAYRSTMDCIPNIEEIRDSNDTSCNISRTNIALANDLKRNLLICDLIEFLHTKYERIIVFGRPEHLKNLNLILSKYNYQIWWYTKTDPNEKASIVFMEALLIQDFKNRETDAMILINTWRNIDDIIYNMIMKKVSVVYEFVDHNLSYCRTALSHRIRQYLRRGFKLHFNQFSNIKDI